MHREILARSIDNLPPKYREAVRMHYVHDQSYAEIADVLQVPLGTLKTWLYRARAQLQETLDPADMAM